MLKHLTIGQRISAAIDYAKSEFDLDMSQTRLAVLMDVSPQAVSGWIRDSKVSRDRLPKIAHLCNVSVIWLLTGEGDMPVKREWYAMPRHKRRTLEIADRDRLSDLYDMEEPEPIKGHAVLNRLAAALEAGKLSEQDLLALEQISKRFKNNV